MDILSIGNVYEKRTYSVSTTNSAVMFFDFQISQTVLGCPVQCTLGEIPSLTDYSNAPITSFDTSTGQISLSTSDLNFVDTSISLAVTCTSLESEHLLPLKQVQDSFIVDFVSSTVNQCDSAMLIPQDSVGTTYYQITTGTDLTIDFPMYFGFPAECPVRFTIY